jgi:hypothetical protein
MTSCVVVFSKDRALQLDGTLRSFDRYARNTRGWERLVLYADSTPRHAGQYLRLARELPAWRFVRERSFQEEVLRVVDGKDLVLWVVDDTLFVRTFDLAALSAHLLAQPTVAGVSLRLGSNTTHSHGAKALLPPMERLDEDARKYEWRSAEGEFAYPFEVSSSIYRTADLLPALSSGQYGNPSMLEGVLAQLAASTPCQDLICLEQSAAFSAPLNRVQTTYANEHGKTHPYPAWMLAAWFDEGFRIEVARLDGFVPHACHLEVELPLHRTDRIVRPGEGCPRRRDDGGLPMDLAVVYVSARAETSAAGTPLPFFAWFFDGLARECRSARFSPDRLQIVLVDLLCEGRPGDNFAETVRDAAERRARVAAAAAGRFPHLEHVPPKPSFLQGAHRMTDHDVFAPSNARNTGLCLARAPHVVFVDDSSVLMPGWLAAHLDAARGGYLLCGLTNRCRGLVVDGEGLLSRHEGVTYVDPRPRLMPPGDGVYAPTDASGAWSFGGQFSVPLEAMLAINGADEAYDGQAGADDGDLGIRITRAGASPMRITRSCVTVQSEDRCPHNLARVRSDRLFRQLQREANRWTPLHTLDVRALRARVQAGEPFPMPVFA